MTGSIQRLLEFLVDHSLKITTRRFFTRPRSDGDLTEPPFNTCKITQGGLLELISPRDDWE
ncbi:MAG: hypothetical protein QW303_00920 [Nitrososphaerota archaeon]